LIVQSYEEAYQKLLKALKNYSYLFTGLKKVLVKPNLLSPRKPDEYVTTHPLIVKAVLEFLLNLGVEVVVGDSPAVGSLERVARVSGIKSVCDEFGVELVPFEDCVSVNGSIFRDIKLAKVIFEVEAVVNLPKLKTHSQMVMTLGVKNTFGCVVGIEKSSWHLKAGTDENFARLLIDVHKIVSPILTVLDGVWGMEGNGPSNGEKKFFGVLAISRNAFALDDAIVRSLGVNPDNVFVLKEARKRGLIPDYEIVGDDFKSSIKLPTTRSFLNRAGRIIEPLIAKVPRFDKKKCVKCGICEERCPSKAINVEIQRINYEKCIRCYVCHEVCPENAMKLVRRVFSLRR